MIRVDAVWLALGVSDLRGGIDVLLGQVVRGFAGGAQPHSAYVFANRRVHVHRVRAENPSAAVAQSTGCQSALGGPVQAKV